MVAWTDLEQVKFQIEAMAYNLLDWFLLVVLKSTSHIQSETDIEKIKADFKESNKNKYSKKSNYCILIKRPGSIHQIEHRRLKDDECTVGYNLGEGISVRQTPIIKVDLNKTESSDTSLTKSSKTSTILSLNPSITPISPPSDCIILNTTHFSINYADICIRWGLYDSANKYCGWPICPGFDVSGVVEWAGKDVLHGLKPGDKVCGASFFGGYSTRILIPSWQVRKVPDIIESNLAMAAALPCTSCTAVHCLNLAGFYPGLDLKSDPTGGTAYQGSSQQLFNKSVLVHSAAGGVGSMLCSIAKYFGASPVVGIVGREQKIRELGDMKVPLKNLGSNTKEEEEPACDYIIQKKHLWSGDELKIKGTMVIESKSGKVVGTVGNTSGTSGTSELTSTPKLASVSMRNRKTGGNSENSTPSTSASDSPAVSKNTSTVTNSTPYPTAQGSLGPDGSPPPLPSLSPSYIDTVNHVNSLKYMSIFDANGVETLSRSYENLAQAGRLVIYGFHTMLPTSSGEAMAMLNPLQWLKMGWVMMFGMPSFDPMLLTVTSKSVFGFNLSFFTKEKKLFTDYFTTILDLIDKKVIGVAGKTKVTVCNDVRDAHEKLSSGKSVGKLVVEL